MCIAVARARTRNARAASTGPSRARSTERSHGSTRPGPGSCNPRRAKRLQARAGDWAASRLVPRGFAAPPLARMADPPHDCQGHGQPDHQPAFEMTNLAEPGLGRCAE